jgi:hypothetical protein
VGALAIVLNAVFTDGINADDIDSFEIAVTSWSSPNDRSGAT